MIYKISFIINQTKSLKIKEKWIIVFLDRENNKLNNIFKELNNFLIYFILFRLLQKRKILNSFVWKTEIQKTLSIGIIYNFYLLERIYF